MVGSGQRLPCEGVVRQVTVLIQGCTIVEDLYALPFQGEDVVLGVSWLSTLGRVITDYATREFEFTLHCSKWLWKGDSPTDAQQIQLHSLRRMTTTDAIASFSFLAMITHEGSCTGEMTTDLSSLLESYHDVFQKPIGLPPSRAHTSNKYIFSRNSKE